MLHVLVRIMKWSVLGPLLVVGGACLFVLDQVLPRYFLVGVLIAPFAGWAYCSGKSLHPYLIAWAVTAW